MKKLCDFIRNLFLVPRCYVCRKAIGKEETGLCDYHRRQYAEERQIRCPICHISYDKCRCLPQFASPYIRSYTRVARYREQSAVGKMLLRAKDSSEGRLYDFLAKEMVNVLQNAGVSVDLVTYIPCSKESFERRGFDHGERLAKRIAKQLCISAEATLLCKKGEAQKTLQAQQRLENSKKRFAPKRGAGKKIAGKRVLLVDDILTSGASSLVASIHLNELGAQSVDFVCFGGK